MLNKLWRLGSGVPLGEAPADGLLLFPGFVLPAGLSLSAVRGFLTCGDSGGASSIVIVGIAFPRMRVGHTTVVLGRGGAGTFVAGAEVVQAE